MFDRMPGNEQESPNIHSFYLEGAGALLFSLNYDRLLNSKHIIRVGINPFSFRSFNFRFSEFYPVGTLAYSFLHGTGKHRLETGISFNYGREISGVNPDYLDVPSISLNLGYRFVDYSKNGNVVRITFTPILSDRGLRPWGTVSFGFSL